MVGSGCRSHRKLRRIADTRMLIVMSAMEQADRKSLHPLPARSGYTFLASNPLFQRENPLVLPFRGDGLI